MVHIIQAGSEESLEALARADLIILDWDHGLTAKDHSQKEVARRGAVKFLGYYHTRGKPFVASSERAKESVVDQISEFGWQGYVSLVLGDSHIGARRGQQIRILGRGLANFRPVPKNPVLVGIDSKINQNSCAEYNIPLIAVPAREVNLRDDFNFVRLYQGEGFRAWVRLAQEVLDYQVF